MIQYTVVATFRESKILRGLIVFSVCLEICTCVSSSALTVANKFMLIKTLIKLDQCGYHATWMQ